MNDPKIHPDFQSAWPDLLNGEEVAIPLSQAQADLTPEQEQIVNRFYGEMLARMTPETAVKKLRAIWNANREVLKNDDLAWLAMIADWLQAQQSKEAK